MRVHSLLDASRANGPGLRFVVWVQGCTLKCSGCFNPQTHDVAAGVDMSVERLIEAMRSATEEVEGVSISGGEPFQQAAELKALLQAIRGEFNWSVVVFTGYSKPEVEALPEGAEILGRVDVLVAGRFVARRAPGPGLLGSDNQALHFLTGRYTPADFENLPEAEVIVLADGTLVVSGIRPPLTA